MTMVITDEAMEITYDNGWTVSVGFGRGHEAISYGPNEYDETHVQTVEVAAWDADDNWHEFLEYSFEYVYIKTDVRGHMTMDELAVFQRMIMEK